VPEGLEDKNSPAWNKGRIHHASATEEVRRAYAVQWANDLSNFLNARAREIVPGGIIVIVTHSIPDGMEYSELANGMMYNCMASILLDIAKRVSQFNYLLFYFLSSTELALKYIKFNG
jgi:hypothetical protein